MVSVNYRTNGRPFECHRLFSINTGQRWRNGLNRDFQSTGRKKKPIRGSKNTLVIKNVPTGNLTVRMEIKHYSELLSDRQKLARLQDQCIYM
jgi:hypothetical protein